MGEDILCKCTKEKAIEELKAEVARLRDFQHTDHDLLIRLDIKFDSLSEMMEKVDKKLNQLMEQPTKRYEHIKLAGAVAVVTAILSYFVNLILTM
jgi:hypothetical protein